MHSANAYASLEDMEYWSELLNAGKIDFSKEKLAPLSCVFCASAKFDNGYTADIKVCTDTVESGQLWSEMVVYDEDGVETYVSEVSDHLRGDWEVGDYHVFMDVSPFDRIHTKVSPFLKEVRKQLLNGITGEYVDKIAEAIVTDVAEDVAETADPDAYNFSDVRLAIGRVLLKALKVEV